MSSAARIVASLTETPSSGDLEALSGRVDVLEVRADLVKDLSATWLRQHFEGELLFTLRSRDEGGCSDASDEARRQRLLAAADEFDWIDLQAARDLDESLLTAIDRRKRLISWHGPSSTLSEMQAIFERMADHPARYYKLVVQVTRSGQEMAPLALLHSLRRDDVISFATGSVGRWTRLVGPRLGAPVIFCAAGPIPAAAGQFSVAELHEHYRITERGGATDLYGLVGRDIGHSLSPRIHNNLYRRFGIEGLYLPFDVTDFGDFWIEIVESGSFPELGFSLRGLSVTAPYKGIASAVAGARSPLVDWINSSNTLVYEDEVWEAESTDGLGVLSALDEAGKAVAGAEAAVLGAGGSGRAVTVALSRAGAKVVLVNRNLERGIKTAKQLRVPFRSWEGFDATGFDIVVHATSLGSEPDDELALDPTQLDKSSILVDLVYTNEGPSRLVSEARSTGRTAIGGRTIVVHQARPQFRMLTGHEPSLAQVRSAAGLT